MRDLTEVIIQRLQSKPYSEEIKLWNNQGNSDKVYVMLVSPYGAEWALRISYGRRGSVLQSLRKSSRSVFACKRLRDDLIRQKVQKGYRPFDDVSAPSTVVNNAGSGSAITNYLIGSQALNIKLAMPPATSPPATSRQAPTRAQMKPNRAPATVPETTTPARRKIVWDE